MSTRQHRLVQARTDHFVLSSPLSKLAPDPTSDLLDAVIDLHVAAWSCFVCSGTDDAGADFQQLRRYQG